MDLVQGFGAFEVLAPAGMCPVTTRIGSAKEVDTALKGWLKQGYQATV